MLKKTHKKDLACFSYFRKRWWPCAQYGSLNFGILVSSLLLLPLSLFQTLSLLPISTSVLFDTFKKEQKQKSCIIFLVAMLNTILPVQYTPAWHLSFASQIHEIAYSYQPFLSLVHSVAFKASVLHSTRQATGQSSLSWLSCNHLSLQYTKQMDFFFKR